MEESHLQIIRALSDSQIKSKPAWAADSIQNKGKGVIILLHGPPGVGKTYSVECTAVATGRPLLALTIADIGIQEDSIESELASWFYLAERWKAVLLIDEADIFLERRKHTDLARNGIVSAFLRKMEYFSGLLFLTTNRVGHIDEAFMSRVHVVIGYPQLDDEKRRKIWQGFLDKMRIDTGGQIRLSNSAKQFVLQGEESLKIKLNGREIRNALQTAIALAEFEAKDDPDYKEGEMIKVEKEHFERVLHLSRSFRDYLDSIRKDTAEARASNYYGRNDYNDGDEYDHRLGGK
ncbi:P-loop containing nucleoside triphosphate hydrolase protein [Mollisia scopiformis]|uniref:p-loop containing nucleoside triphosphate hydrolase protein n=1 Tax=Mollisia scopiformis TaxID=149040 RepID=A0A194WU32_MOLSC|nr:P-loop containing nucleoside triphosphate hydrolase protein [Mollisia scopiformis]KUJ11463.1 P-loop containing nucleoside triphosphate hydrolase protein [Mollisia scopiformis]